MKEAIAVTVAAIVLTGYFTWPMSLDPAGMGRVQMGDGQFSIWNVAWVAHALTTPGVDLFDANIFHPHRGTLAYSEPNVGAGVLAIPAYLLTGGNPYAAHNSAVLIALAGAFIGMYLLARRLTGSPEASAIAAIAFAFCPFFFARTAHVQLMMTAPLPFTLLAFHRFADDPTWRTALAVGVCLGVQALFCSYYGVLAGLVVGLGILVVAVGQGRWRQPRWWALAILAAVVSVVSVLPVLLPVVQLQQETGFARTLDEARRYSADWRAYFASSAYAHDWMLELIGTWKEVLFPGFTALVGGFAGMIVAWRGDRSRHARTITVFYLLVFGLALWSSFGPAAGLYSVFYSAIPVFSLLRAPARFGLAVTLALAVFTAIAAASVFRRIPDARKRRALAAAVGLFVIAELSTAIPYLPARGVPRAYKVLAAADRGPLIEFPFYYRPQDHFRQALYMLGSTWHWQPLLGGYSDYIPPDVTDGGPILERFPNADGFAWLRERGARYAVFHLNLYDVPSREALRRRIEAHAEYLRPRWAHDSVLLYEIVGFPATVQ
jgi:hypothetical protein